MKKFAVFSLSMIVSIVAENQGVPMQQIVRLVIALIILLASASTAGTFVHADTDKVVRAPEVYLIGETSTYVEDGITVTVEPGVLVLYN